MHNVAHIDSDSPVLGMQDDLGIVYLINSAQQFWSELDDILHLPHDPPTLSLLDATLRRFMALCATYHEQYLQSPLQLEHACDLLLLSELFEFHSERMLDIIIDDAQTITDPHSIFVFYEVLFCYGQRRADFFRSHKRWQPLLPFLMDHILVEIDPSIEDTYAGTAVGRSASYSSVPIPIEAKLRSLSVKLLYEVCKVQTLNAQDLKIFDDHFIDYLFDLVEQTSEMQDDTFNYSVIKLIIALNEQFMVLGLGDGDGHKNRVIKVLTRRMGSCKTFSMNLIFMLNRAQRTPEDFCMTLLILKILYVLFTNRATCEFFYTNDLKVIVDVFVRELNDLNEESESVGGDSLRHTFLRVLHPLLTKSQLKDHPYKRVEILKVLEKQLSNSRIREINPTTKRLVERCLSGDWCVSLMELRRHAGYGIKRAESPYSDTSTIVSPPGDTALSMAAVQHPQTSGSGSNNVMMSMRFSKSVEHFGRSDHHPSTSSQARSGPQERRTSNGSIYSLPGLGSPTASSSLKVPTTSGRRTIGGTADSGHPFRHNSLPVPNTLEGTPSHHVHGHGSSSSLNRLRTDSLGRATSLDTDSIMTATESMSLHEHHPRRKPPPPPPQTNFLTPAPTSTAKRRRPPAIPTRTNGGVTITTIRSSEPSPLSQVHNHQIGVQQTS